MVSLIFWKFDFCLVWFFLLGKLDIEINDWMYFDFIVFLNICNRNYVNRWIVEDF